MGHVLLRASLRVHSAFGTPLAGDTLFGQLCWAACEQLGESGLRQLLDGYTTGKPWLVASDGFPAGFLPRPTMPQPVGSEYNPDKRKVAKAERWIPIGAVGKPFSEMLADTTLDDDAYASKKPIEAAQPHNTLNRLTGTTGTGEFAPYTQRQIFFAPDQAMEIYLVLDEARMRVTVLQSLLQAIGMQGYGRDASIGLGKFSLDELEPHQFALPTTPASSANACTFWTLAPCAPQGQGFDPEKSYWRVITRFGRHGGMHALSTNPFKNPVLLAATGALFATAKSTDALFIGQGLGGNGLISKTEPGTVQQGYAPVIAISMEN
ncbi:MAG: hypothetical protein ABI865_07050 [Nitrosospira sp.]